MTLEEEMNRIADALEKKNQYIADVGDIAWGLTKGVLIGVVIIAVFVLFLIFGGGIYDFFAYDVLGNERVSVGYATASLPPDPIDDCNYSEDKQLCYQMERIADGLLTTSPENTKNLFNTFSDDGLCWYRIVNHEFSPPDPPVVEFLFCEDEWK